jgi:hypothetical protein
MGLPGYEEKQLHQSREVLYPRFGEGDATGDLES